MNWELLLWATLYFVAGVIGGWLLRNEKAKAKERLSRKYVGEALDTVSRLRRVAEDLQQENLRLKRGFRKVQGAR